MSKLHLPPRPTSRASKTLRPSRDSVHSDDMVLASPSHRRIATAPSMSMGLLKTSESDDTNLSSRRYGATDGKEERKIEVITVNISPLSFSQHPLPSPRSDTPPIGSRSQTPTPIYAEAQTQALLAAAFAGQPKMLVINNPPLSTPDSASNTQTRSRTSPPLPTPTHAFPAALTGSGMSVINSPLPSPQSEPSHSRSQSQLPTYSLDIAHHKPPSPYPRPIAPVQYMALSVRISGTEETPLSPIVEEPSVSPPATLHEPLLGGSINADPSSNREIVVRASENIPSHPHEAQLLVPINISSLQFTYPISYQTSSPLHGVQPVVSSTEKWLIRTAYGAPLVFIVAAKEAAVKGAAALAKYYGWSPGGHTQASCELVFSILVIYGAGRANWKLFFVNNSAAVQDFKKLPTEYQQGANWTSVKYGLLMLASVAGAISLSFSGYEKLFQTPFVIPYILPHHYITDTLLRWPLTTAHFACFPISRTLINAVALKGGAQDLNWQLRVTVNSRYRKQQRLNDLLSLLTRVFVAGRDYESVLKELVTNIEGIRNTSEAKNAPKLNLRRQMFHLLQFAKAQGLELPHYGRSILGKFLPFGLGATAGLIYLKGAVDFFANVFRAGGAASTIGFIANLAVLVLQGRSAIKNALKAYNYVYLRRKNLLPSGGVDRVGFIHDFVTAVLSTAAAIAFGLTFEVSFIPTSLGATIAVTAIAALSGGSANLLGLHDARGYVSSLTEKFIQELMAYINDPNTDPNDIDAFIEFMDQQRDKYGKKIVAAIPDPKQEKRVVAVRNELKAKFLLEEKGAEFFTGTSTSFFKTIGIEADQVKTLLTSLLEASQTEVEAIAALAGEIQSACNAAVPRYKMPVGKTEIDKKIALEYLDKMIGSVSWRLGYETLRLIDRYRDRLKLSEGAYNMCFWQEHKAEPVEPSPAYPDIKTETTRRLGCLWKVARLKEQEGSLVRYNPSDEQKNLDAYQNTRRMTATDHYQPDPADEIKYSYIESKTHHRADSKNEVIYTKSSATVYYFESDDQIRRYYKREKKDVPIHAKYDHPDILRNCYSKRTHPSIRVTPHFFSPLEPVGKIQETHPNPDLNRNKSENRISAKLMRREPLNLTHHTVHIVKPTDGDATHFRLVAR